MADNTKQSQNHSKPGSTDSHKSSTTAVHHPKSSSMSGRFVAQTSNGARVTQGFSVRRILKTKT